MLSLPQSLFFSDIDIAIPASLCIVFFNDFLQIFLFSIFLYHSLYMCPL